MISYGMVSRSGVVISITNCYIRFTLLYFTLQLEQKYIYTVISSVLIQHRIDHRPVLFFHPDAVLPV